jgi:hypothetical protein
MTVTPTVDQVEQVEQVVLLDADGAPIGSMD